MKPLFNIALAAFAGCIGVTLLPIGCFCRPQDSCEAHLAGIGERPTLRPTLRGLLEGGDAARL